MNIQRTIGPTSTIFENNYFRFGVTFLLCLQYSLLKETTYSTITKPLPIIFWLFIVLFSRRKQSGRWVIISLCFAFLGDILLDLGDQWLRIGALPFLLSTAFLALAFHMRLRNSEPISNYLLKGFLLVIIAVPFMLLHQTLIQYSTEAGTIGAILFTIATFLLWTSLSNLLFNKMEKDDFIRPFLGVVGACGIIANYVLYSIDLYMMPIPRDVVIQVYYWGTAFVAWSFLLD